MTSTPGGVLAQRGCGQLRAASRRPGVRPHCGPGRPRATPGSSRRRSACSAGRPPACGRRSGAGGPPRRTGRCTGRSSPTGPAGGIRRIQGVVERRDDPLLQAARPGRSARSGTNQVKVREGRVGRQFCLAKTHKSRMALLIRYSSSAGRTAGAAPARPATRCCRVDPRRALCSDTTR